MSAQYEHGDMSSCERCGQDIQFLPSPRRRGDFNHPADPWLDRGGNGHCNDGQVHEPMDPPSHFRVVGCTICLGSDHTAESHWDWCFEGYTVPDDIRRTAQRIAQAYGIRGQADPMYIANVIGTETGRGNGAGVFTS